jgi:hypothetical protein
LSSVKVAYEKKITEGHTADNSEATCLPAKAGKYPGFLFPHLHSVLKVTAFSNFAF